MNRSIRTALAAALTLGLAGFATAQNQPEQQNQRRAQGQTQQAEQQQKKAQKQQREARQAQQQDEQQQQPTQRRQQQQQQQNQAEQSGSQLKIERAGDLLEFDVYNMQGQKLGAIEDIVLDAHSAEVAYIVLEHDDPVFDKHFAVPLGLVKLGRADNERVAVIDVPAAALRQAPTFDENEIQSWPERANPFFARFMQPRERAEFEGRGIPPQPAERSRIPIADEDRETWDIDRWFSFHDPMESRRLTQIIGMDVQNLRDDDLGEIEDVAVDMRTGRVAYAIISYGGALEVGQEMAAVPWTAMKPRLDDDEFVLNTDRGDLTEYRIEPNENLASVDFGRRLHERFNLEPYWVGAYGFAGEGEFEGGGAWSAQSQFNQQYDAEKSQTIEGELISVGSFRPAAGADEGMRLRIRTEDGRTVTVYAGPSWFARQRDFDLDRGDQVTIVGSQATVDNRQVILAKEVRSEDKTLQLRDEQGRPQWQDEQRQRYERQRRQQQGRDVYGTDRQQSDYERQRPVQQRDDRGRPDQQYDSTARRWEYGRDREWLDPRYAPPTNQESYGQRQWYEERSDSSRERYVPQSRSDYERQRMQQQYQTQQRNGQAYERSYDDRYQNSRTGDEGYDRFEDRPLTDEWRQEDRSRIRADEGRQWQTYGSERDRDEPQRDSRYEDR